MSRFVDEVQIEISSGSGGPGVVSFRREKGVPFGGPDGGDGGDGGNVYFEIREDLHTLYHLKFKKHLIAQNGKPGQKKRQHGKNGVDLVIPLPIGSMIRSKETGQILKDFSSYDFSLFLSGGKGGKGNAHFKTSTCQAPRFAQEGKKGLHSSLLVELRSIADLGFVGFPNAGKSSLTNALVPQVHSKMAQYPFTTLIPHLGVLEHYEKRCVLADIPGIVQGAAQGKGLGNRFLRHISRVRIIAYVIDISLDSYREHMSILENEIKTYIRSHKDSYYHKQKFFIIANKADLENSGKNYENLKEIYPHMDSICVSSFNVQDMENLKIKIFSLL